MKMYTLQKQGVFRTVDQVSIPEDPENTDWVEYQRWLDEGNEPNPIPEPSQEENQRQLLNQNNAAYTAMTSQLTGDYPQLEKDTWPTQDKEVQGWIEDPDNAATPWIDLAASERDLDREEYIRRTIIKAAQFKVMSSFLTGRRQKYEDAIKRGETPELDFNLTPAVMQELHRIATSVMTTSAKDMSSLTL